MRFRGQALSAFLGSGMACIADSYSTRSFNRFVNLYTINALSISFSQACLFAPAVYMSGVRCYVLVYSWNPLAMRFNSVLCCVVLRHIVTPIQSDFACADSIYIRHPLFVFWVGDVRHSFLSEHC